LIILESTRFKIHLKTIAFFIKKDNRNASIRFVKELKLQINQLIDMPKKYQQSKYYDDETIRDMVFKGYTIIYKIYSDKIIILEIFNQNLPILEEE